MPSELRYIMFTEKEVAEAAVAFLASRSIMAPGSKNAKAAVETMNESSIVVTFQKDVFGKRERRVLTSYEAIEALIAWCRSKAVVLPLNARKDLMKIGPVLCLRSAVQIPERNVDQVERLILAKSTQATISAA